MTLPLPILIVFAAASVPAYNVVAVKDVKPARVAEVTPKLKLVLPIVTELFARLLLAIDVPVVKTVPVLSGRVIVLSAVASLDVNVVSYASAVAPSKIIVAPVMLSVLVAPATPV